MSENIDDHKHDLKRVFLSEEKNDNALDCIISKVKIVHIDPNMDPEAKAQLVADCELYYDMSYTVAYSIFANIPSENGASGSDTASGISSDDVDSEVPYGTPVRKAALLDLYSGCGGMSTGLCLGAALAGLKLETRWAVDLNSFACESLRYNHPDTEVRNEKAEEFLALLREWAVLCDKHVYGDAGSDSAGPSEDEEEDGRRALILYQLMRLVLSLNKAHLTLFCIFVFIKKSILPRSILLKREVSSQALSATKMPVKLMMGSLPSMYFIYRETIALMVLLLTGRSKFWSFLSLGHDNTKLDRLYMRGPEGRGEVEVAVFGIAELTK